MWIRNRPETGPIVVDTNGCSSTWQAAALPEEFDQRPMICLLYPSDAADDRSGEVLGGRRLIKKKNVFRDLDVVYVERTAYNINRMVEIICTWPMVTD